MDTDEFHSRDTVPKPLYVEMIPMVMRHDTYVHAEQPVT